MWDLPPRHVDVHGLTVDAEELRGLLHGQDLAFHATDLGHLARQDKADGDLTVHG